MKKKINLLLSFLVLTCSGLPLNACQNNWKFDEASKKDEIIKAINQIGYKKHLIKKDSDIAQICDIEKINQINVKYDKNIAFFSYDIVFFQAKQLHQNFLETTNLNRQPNITGNFRFNWQSQAISDNKININYLPGIYKFNYFQKTWNILIGTKKDFYLILNGTDWDYFLTYVEDNIGGDGANNCLKFLEIFNSNIILSNQEWRCIIDNLNVLVVNEKYAVCLHVIKTNNTNYKIAYTNLTTSDKKNMPLPGQAPHLPIFVFHDNETKKFQQHYWFNQSILSYLNDIYTDKTMFHHNNWTLKGIERILLKNKLITTNLNSQQIAETLINLFQQHDDLVNNWLVLLKQSNNTGVMLTFDYLNSLINCQLIHENNLPINL